MDEQKQSESSWEEAERLGPYQIHEQVPQSEHGRGELYRATHETSGATALVFKPAAEKDAVPLKDWQVRVISSASPGYVALEPVKSPWSVGSERHSVEVLVFTCEALRDAVRRMAHHLPASDAPHPGWRLGLGLAGAAAVCALFFALVRLAPVSQPSSDPEPLASATSAPTHQDMSMAAKPLESHLSIWLGNTTPPGEFVLARPLPREPLKGQKRPPCTRLVEVELIGACWGPHKLKAPCPDQLIEHQGECYAPIFNARPPPQSIWQ